MIAARPSGFRPQAVKRHQRLAVDAQPLVKLTIPSFANPVFLLLHCLAGLSSTLRRLVDPRVKRVRVPVVTQSSVLDCGAACLAMLLNYYGRRTSLEEVRQRCGVGRDGTTAKALAEAARSYGMRVRAYSSEPEQLPVTGLPAIVHWRFNHFVVVESWAPRHVEIVDPAVGRRRLSPEEFDADFTGVVLAPEPGDEFTRRAGRRASAWRGYAARIRQLTGLTRLVAWLLATSALLELIGLGLPVLMQLLVDGILPRHMGNVMLVLGLGIVVLIAVQTATTYARGMLLLWLQMRLDAQLMPSLVAHLLSLPLSFFKQRASGDLLMRLAADTAVREMLTGQGSAAVLDGVMVVTYAAILLVRAPVWAWSQLRSDWPRPACC